MRSYTADRAGEKVFDYFSLLDGLTSSGLHIEQITEVSRSVFGAHGNYIFSVDAKAVKLGENRGMLVLEYPDEGTARAETQFVSRDGYGLSRPGSGFYLEFEFVSTPHWFQSGRIIVLYNGPGGPENDYETLAAVNKLLGMQFAGRGPVREDNVRPNADL